jgi:exodeoxyribonuclease-3
MKIISFNINGIRARLAQLQAVIDLHQPDVLGLQEIKVDNAQFPVEAVKAMGYDVVFHGQKGHYGVAILSKHPIKQVQYGLPTDTEAHQKRLIGITIEDPQGEDITIYNGYFPQGENIQHETKFPYKVEFYRDLTAHLSHTHHPDEQIVVMGDINISPTDLDIGIGDVNRKRWLKSGKCSFQPIEREMLATLQAFGLTDTFRALYPEKTERYSWFDYRSKGFDDNRGLRIDVILATPSLAARCVESEICYVSRGLEKPSDHAPIFAEFS